MHQSILKHSLKYIYSILNSILYAYTKPTTFDHINIKCIWGPHGKPFKDPTLMTYRDLQKVYILNKYNFFSFIYYKETMKIFIIHIN